MTRTDSNSLRPLPPRSLAALLLAMFAIAIALVYGFLLPILPSTIARIAGTSDPAILAQHTGVLTGTYTLALFLFAPLWGHFSDRYGRRPAIVAGLVGFALTLMLFAMAGNLSSLYLGRFLNGAFAASIAPAAYALVRDERDERQGADLGWQTASASLGQAAGSAAGGLLFGVVLVPNASFTLTAIVVLAASIGLPRLLKQPEREGPDAPASTGTSRTAAEEGRRS
ncbi:MFS transporter [Rhizobium sp. SG741]|uniref:MFS transporter n=1 Tax=Rhizobium sp. SG741 TaxID=2587114 RepID=UPI0014473FAF|nr:MFS transporter [Rhizobium sp. SG741]NKJ08178.1 MFS family permease [Rhizobium sp. SG741]